MILFRQYLTRIKVHSHIILRHCQNLPKYIQNCFSMTMFYEVNKFVSSCYWQGINVLNHIILWGCINGIVSTLIEYIFFVCWENFLWIYHVTRWCSWKNRTREGSPYKVQIIEVQIIKVQIWKHQSFKGRKIIADTLLLVNPHWCNMFFPKVAVVCLRKMYHWVLAASKTLTALLPSLQAI